MAKPSIWNFLRDPESQRSVGNGLLDAANRGMVASTLGGPVDVATTLTNLLIAGGGYAGHKAGLLSSPPELIDSRNVPGSSEWIGQKMQNAGMVSQNRNALAEAGMGLLSPVAYKGAQKMGGLLYNVEQNALANAFKPSTFNALTRGQGGAVVWHGSPYKFDKFDSSKIGTGEGAQAYGHGLYFAESRDVAKNYTDFVKRVTPLDLKDARSLLLEMKTDNFRRYKPEQIAAQERVVQNMTDIIENKSLYKVDIPDEVIAKMLDWDKPISQQHQHVQKAIAGISPHGSPDVVFTANQTGSDVVEKLNSKLGSQAAVSNALRQVGISGVRYLDGNSRTANQGTSNFVLFPGNDGLPNIVERNGVPVK